MAVEQRIILISINKSQHSEYAFKYYLDVLYNPSHKIVLGHVDELPTTEGEVRKHGFTGLSLRKEAAREESDAKELFQKFREMAAQKGVGHVEAVIKSGLHPGEGILALAKERGVHSIVIGTRGKGSIKRAIQGSVSDHVLHHAHCPVVVCRQ